MNIIFGRIVVGGGPVGTRPGRSLDGLADPGVAGALALAKRNPRWRVLLWRSAAVGLATIVILTAAPPVVTWRVPLAESIVVPAAPRNAPCRRRTRFRFCGRGLRIADRQTSAAGPPRRSESATRSMGGPAVLVEESGQDQAEPRVLVAGDLAARSRRDGGPAGLCAPAIVEDRCDGPRRSQPGSSRSAAPSPPRSAAGRPFGSSSRRKSPHPA